ncbi:hypothetical protein JCM8547_009021 [Rhodosporidiobolus lusitaniae]
MSWSKLPTELKEMIVKLVDEEDRRIRKRLKELALNPVLHVTRTNYGAGGYPHGLGVRFLSETSKDCRRLVIPYLFSPLDLSKINSYAFDECINSEVGQLVRSVRLSTFEPKRYGWRRSERNLASIARQLKALDQMPQYYIPNDEEDDELPPRRGSFFRWRAPGPDEKPERYRCHGMTPAEAMRAGAFLELVRAAERVTSWGFENTGPEHMFEFDDEEDEEAPGRDYLSQDWSELRNALAACTSLRSLGISSHSLSASGDIHSDWLLSSFPSSLTSLHLSLSYANPSLLSFLALFPHLRHLSLRLTGNFRSLSSSNGKNVTFPSLSSLSVHRTTLKQVDKLLRHLGTPILETLSLSAAKAFNSGDWDAEQQILDNTKKQIRRRTNLHKVHLKAMTEDGIWPSYHRQELELSFSPDTDDSDDSDDPRSRSGPSRSSRTGRPCTTSTSTMALSRCPRRRMLTWGLRRVEELERMGPPYSREMSTILFSLGELYKMQAAVEA